MNHNDKMTTDIINREHPETGSSADIGWDPKTDRFVLFDYTRVDGPDSTDGKITKRAPVFA